MRVLTPFQQHQDELTIKARRDLEKFARDANIPGLDPDYMLVISIPGKRDPFATIVGASGWHDNWQHAIDRAREALTELESELHARSGTL